MEQRGAIMLRSQGKHSPLKSTGALHDQMCRNKSPLANGLEKSVMPLAVQCRGRGWGIKAFCESQGECKAMKPSHEGSGVLGLSLCASLPLTKRLDPSEPQLPRL